MWRPWAGSLLEALPTLKCYNLHALTIVIVTKYIYIFCRGPLVVEAPGQLPSLPPPRLKSGRGVLAGALHRFCPGWLIPLLSFLYILAFSFYAFGRAFCRLLLCVNMNSVLVPGDEPHTPLGNS